MMPIKRIWIQIAIENFISIYPNQFGGIRENGHNIVCTLFIYGVSKPLVTVTREDEFSAVTHQCSSLQLSYYWLIGPTMNTALQPSSKCSREMLTPDWAKKGLERDKEL